tara:strand:- start:317 stop:748 length:432 start_codon:yes stop_codon:yes gene_type:complete
MFCYILYHKIKNLNLENRIKKMPKPSWGRKIKCHNDNCPRFYDLNRKPIVCPSCNEPVEEGMLDESSSEAKKVFSDDVKSINETNLVGNDPTESIASDEDLPLEEVEGDETISLEEADQDVDVIDTEVDDLSLEQNGNEAEED